MVSINAGGLVLKGSSEGSAASMDGRVAQCGLVSFLA